MDAIPDIKPEQARELWVALFAITHAVEQLGMLEEVNGYKNTATGLGAWETAREVLEASVVKPADMN